MNKINFVSISFFILFSNLSLQALLVDPKEILTFEGFLKRLPAHKKEIATIIRQDDVVRLRANTCMRINPNTLLHNYTLLTFAINSSAKSCITALVTELGADVNKLDEYTISPLLYVLKKNTLWDIAQLLFDSGARVNLRQGVDQHYPLWIFFSAVENGEYTWEHYLQQMRWLLQHGANPNRYKDILSRALIHSHSQNGVDLIGWLCEAGADVNARMCNFNNKTILHHAVQRPKSYSFDYQIILLWHLLHAGGDLNVQDDYGSTPLHEAVINNEQPDTPLCRGAENTNADCIAFLLYQGAHPEFKNKEGKKPIDYAKQPEVRAMLQNPKQVVLPERVKKILESLQKPKVPCEKIK